MVIVDRRCDRCGEELGELSCPHCGAGDLHLPRPLIGSPWYWECQSCEVSLFGMACRSCGTKHKFRALYAD